MQGEVNGIKFEYDENTQFKVQVRKNKTAYGTRFTTGNLAQAVLLYSAVNIGNGYRKRLLLCTSKETKELAKAAS